MATSEINEVGLNATEIVPICKKFLWGVCRKYTNCKFRHAANIEEMVKSIKFCHDFQNSNGCIRADCTYLHTTKQEEKLFRENKMLAPLIEKHLKSITEAVAMGVDMTVVLESYEFVPDTCDLFTNNEKICIPNRLVSYIFQNTVSNAVMINTENCGVQANPAQPANMSSTSENGSYVTGTCSNCSKYNHLADEYNSLCGKLNIYESLLSSQINHALEHLEQSKKIIAVLGPKNNEKFSKELASDNPDYEYIMSVMESQQFDIEAILPEYKAHVKQTEELLDNWKKVREESESVG